MNTVSCAYPWRKLFLLTALLFVLSRLTDLVFGFPLSVPGASSVELYASLLAEAAIKAAVILELLRKSSWRGFKLGLAVFTVYFGVVGVLTGIESLIFLSDLNKMPARDIYLGMAQGFLTAMALGWMAAAIAGPSQELSEENPASRRLPGPEPLRWAWRMTLVALVYIPIFFLFGAFVAVPLAGPAFHEFYRDLKPTAWLPLIELARGYIWALLTVLIVRMLSVDRSKAALLTGLIFSLLMGAMLIAPNPIIDSDRLRWSHFVEVSTSNFLFGWLAVRILTLNKTANRNEFSGL